MRKANYQLVDVFTDVPFGGNPLAVFLEGNQVHESEMATIAKELNLSETTFVFPPLDQRNDYKVRIFTPGGELPMAGHPTIGTAFLLARKKIRTKGESTFTLLLEENIGVIPVEVTTQNGIVKRVTMEMPTPVFSPPAIPAPQIAALLSLEENELRADCPIQTVSCGVPYLIVGVNSLSAIQKINFRADIWQQLRAEYNPGFIYVFCTETVREGSDVHGRMFAPEIGVSEDAATGSANGPLGAYLFKHNLVAAKEVTHIKSEQGFEMGRPSILYITVYNSPYRVTVGGDTIPMGVGEMWLY